jgi:3-oxoacyl-[acyl-carrier-protein] synthase III
MSNVIMGIGTYLPERIVTNDDLEAMELDYDGARKGGVSLDEWVRTGTQSSSSRWGTTL